MGDDHQKNCRGCEALENAWLKMRLEIREVVSGQVSEIVKPLIDELRDAASTLHGVVTEGKVQAERMRFGSEKFKEMENEIKTHDADLDGMEQEINFLKQWKSGHDAAVAANQQASRKTAVNWSLLIGVATIIVNVMLHVAFKGG